jgi:hypothetical protein
VLLKGIAALYDVPFELLVQRFVEANYGIEVRVRAPGTGSSMEADVLDPTLTRVIDLETRVAQYQSTISELRDIVDRSGLVKVTSEKKSALRSRERRAQFQGRS